MPPVQCTCAVAFICVHKGEFILRYPTIPLFRYFAIPLFRYFAFITESSPLRTVGPAQKCIYPPLFRYFAIPLFRYSAFITESSPLRTVGPAQKSASGGRGKPANHWQSGINSLTEHFEQFNLLILYSFYIRTILKKCVHLYNLGAILFNCIQFVHFLQFCTIVIFYNFVKFVQICKFWSILTFCPVQFALSKFGTGVHCVIYVNTSVHFVHVDTLNRNRNIDTRQLQGLANVFILLFYIFI